VRFIGLKICFLKRESGFESRRPHHMSHLSAENLQLWRGETHVLRGVSFVLRRGQCLQVSGANGAGKTTLLRALCGLVPLEDGQIRWGGADIRHDLSAFQSEIAYLGHDNGLKGDLTAHENLHYSVGLQRELDVPSIPAALTRTGVGAYASAQVRRLSAGQRRRVALARLILSEAALWILDEPGSNLDEGGQELLGVLLDAHLRAGGTAVVATHQALTLPAFQLHPLLLA
jgi:heme exporter protein A